MDPAALHFILEIIPSPPLLFFPYPTFFPLMHISSLLRVMFVTGFAIIVVPVIVYHIQVNDYAPFLTNCSWKEDIWLCINDIHCKQETLICCWWKCFVFLRDQSRICSFFIYMDGTRSIYWDHKHDTQTIIVHIASIVVNKAGCPLFIYYIW